MSSGDSDPWRTTQARTMLSSNDLPPFGNGQGLQVYKGKWGLNLHQVSLNTCRTGVETTWAGDLGCEFFPRALCDPLDTVSSLLERSPGSERLRDSRL